MNEPIICFGQQPCGFFPKRFLIAKINTARSLQKEIGGKIIFFYHDSDADYRETITIFIDQAKLGADLSADLSSEALAKGEALAKAEVRLNFTQENKIQKKFSPLYLKRVPVGWKEEILKQLPRFVDPVPFPSPSGGGIKGEGAVDIFKSVNAKTAADFCLEMYKKMGLLNGIEIIRSSDKNFRQQASELDKDYFADVEYQGEVVRAKVEPVPPSPHRAKPLIFLPHLGGDVTSDVTERVISGEKSSGSETERLQPTYTSSVPIAIGTSSPPSSAKATAGRQGEEGNTTGILHEGGNKFVRFPISEPIQKWQKNPARDERFAWMQSVIHCTHYVAGNSEFEYLNKQNFPEVKFIKREQIDQAENAWIDN